MTKTRVRVGDPRLLIGIGLVVASVAGVWGVVAAADDTVRVVAAAHPLAQGDRVGASDFTTVSVGVGQAAGLYLAPSDVPEGGFIVTRPVWKGELVPRSAVGSGAGARLASVVVSVEEPLAASVVAGATVDIWAAREDEAGDFVAPVALVSGAPVVRLVASETIIGAGETTAVEVLVPRSQVGRVLEAIANDDALSVIAATVPLEN